MKDINLDLEDTDSYKEFQAQLPPQQDDKRHYSVLVVTHYGFIREFFNIFKLKQNKEIMGTETKYSYYAQNASLFQVRLQLDG